MNLFLIYLIVSAAIVLGGLMFLGNRAQPVRNADNLAAICKQIG
jgi:hypothetical protein